MNAATRRRLVRGGLALILVVIAIQAVPYGRDHANPQVAMEPAWDSPRTRLLAKQACFDCHSNETRWPAYSQAAPVSWMIQRNVDEGRAALNFSEWQRPQEEAHEAPDKVLERQMPPLLYQLMHAGARLTESERAALALGLRNTLGQQRDHVSRAR